MDDNFDLANSSNENKAMIPKQSCQSNGEENGKAMVEDHYIENRINAAIITWDLIKSELRKKYQPEAYQFDCVNEFTKRTKDLVAYYY